MKFALLALLTLAGCSTTLELDPELNRGPPGAPVMLSSDSVKLKAREFHVQLRLENMIDDFVLILASDLRCDYGGGRGRTLIVARGFVWSGMDIGLNPDEIKTIMLYCELEDGEEPPALKAGAVPEVTVRLKNVYRKTGDGKQETVAEDLVWKPKLPALK